MLLSPPARLSISTDVADSRVTVRWGDIEGLAVARPGYGSILLRPGIAPGFDPEPIARHLPQAALRPGRAAMR